MNKNVNLNEEEMKAFAEAAVQYNVERELRKKYESKLALEYSVRKEQNTVLKWPNWMKIAAVFLAIVGSVFVIQNIASTPSLQTIAQNQLDQTTITGNPDITRKGANTALQLRREANDAFTLKNYPLAVSKYKMLVTTPESTALDQFYLAVSHLKMSNYTDAIPIFEALRAEQQFEMEEVDWLLGLTYILANQKQKASPIFQTIVADSKYKAQEAKIILDAME